jgi:hypothetical protein
MRCYRARPWHAWGTRFSLRTVPQTSSPTFMEASKAAATIRGHVDPTKPLTVADAAAATGLALRDAESGLKWLSSEYRGMLRVTSEGQLVHVFPSGFTKPWAPRDARQRALHAVGHALASALRFIVRAWVAVVLVGYAAIFVALLLGITFARQGGDSRREGGLPGGALGYAFLRVVGDALFWTFHPWSPFSVYGGYAGGWEGGGYGYARARPRSREPRVPLYERVNRFFFGPHGEEADPLENERRIVAAIRAGKGRIGLADVMRVTGLERGLADALMAKLMLDYDGDVAVSDDGGIVYRFPEIRKTASEGPPAEPSPVWARAKPLEPLTGNPVGANIAIVAINAFNLFMAWWCIENAMTIERASHLFDRIPRPFVDTGTPIALGVVPLIFSALLFIVPAVRGILRPWRARAATRERGRLAVLRAVLERVRAKAPVTDRVVADAWTAATGSAPPPKSLDRQLVALGGDVAIEPEGQTRWRFADFETEAAAVEAEREAAADDEARIGKVVFATDER